MPTVKCDGQSNLGHTDPSACIVPISKAQPLWNILDRILQLLNDKIQIVPSIVGEQTRIERQRYLEHVRLGVFKSEVFNVPLKTRHRQTN